jgi:hypothetical protein
VSGKIKVITFHSEGYPHDEALPLTGSKVVLQNLVESQGYEFEAYTPRRVRQLDAANLVRKFDDRYAMEKNPGLHLLGMFAWKPFIMLHALQSMDENDLLIYSDANIEKYPGLQKRLADIRSLVDETIGDYAFFIAREFPHQRVKTAAHASGVQLTIIGANTDFACNFPTHIASRLIVRNNPEAREILVYWLALCMVDKFILPPMQGDIVHEVYRWFCAEQSVLNLILANLIEEGRLPYFYAGIGIDRDGNRFVADNSHIESLSPPIGRDGYVPFATRFAKEIMAAERFLASRFSQIGLWSTAPRKRYLAAGA